MSGLPKNYSTVIVSLLNHAWIVFGPFTDDNRRDVAAWVKSEMDRIREEQR